MTLFNKLGRKKTQKSRKAMMMTHTGEGEHRLVEPVESTSTVVDMRSIEHEAWRFYPPPYEVSQHRPPSTPIVFNYDHQHQMGGNAPHLHIHLPPQSFFPSPTIPPSTGQSSNTPPTLGTAGHASGSGSPFEVVKHFFESSLPFIILLFIKISFNHKTGIMFFLAMYGTFMHCNSKAIELMLPGKLSLSGEFTRGVVVVVAIIIASVSLIYYTFADQQLYRSLYLFPPMIRPIDLWGMLWVIGATDFVIKFVTVALKLMVTSLPISLLCSRKRGQWYQFFEVLSQFYRSVVPITPWIYFLLDDSGGGGYWLSLILLVAYLVCKSLDLYDRLKELWRSALVILHKSVIGLTPSKSQLDSFGTNCPICHDTFHDPIMLTCNHIFCEECITAWFDRERTCPMCRSKVQHAPKWRDGRTSASIQFY